MWEGSRSSKILGNGSLEPPKKRHFCQHLNFTQVETHVGLLKVTINVSDVLYSPGLEQQKIDTLPLALEEEEEKGKSTGYECVCVCVCKIIKDSWDYPPENSVILEGFICMQLYKWSSLMIVLLASSRTCLRGLKKQSRELYFWILWYLCTCVVAFLYSSHFILCM